MGRQLYWGITFTVLGEAFIIDFDPDFQISGEVAFKQVPTEQRPRYTRILENASPMPGFLILTGQTSSLVFGLAFLFYHIHL